MLSFLFRRFFSSLVVLFCVVTITFFLARLMPGGPFDKEKEPPAHIKKALLVRYKLDGPEGRAFGDRIAASIGIAPREKDKSTRLGDAGSLVQQYGAYLGDLLRGDMRVSFKYRDWSVAEMIGQKMPNSIQIGTMALLIASIGGVFAGSVAALRRDQWPDVTLMFGALTAVSVPTFVTGPFLIAVFGLWLGWFPVGGWGRWEHVVLPSLCLAAPYLAYVARLMRNSLLDVLKSEFMRTARAKGLSNSRALWRHAMKVAILPVVTFLGPLAANLLTGSMVVEAVFNISGAGSLFVNSIQNNDFFLLVGAVSLYCGLVIFFNFMVDVLYGVLDKRIKLYA